MPLDNYNTRPDFSRQIKQYSGTTAILSGETNILEKFSVKNIELDTNGALPGDLLLFNGTKFTPAAQGSFVNVIFNGLILSYKSGLTYNVSEGSYQINTKPYTYTGGTVNILSGDSLYSRFDVVFITSAKTPTVLTGTPSLAPVVPLISSSTQIQIGIISVPALFTGGTGATILQVTSNTVFDYYSGGSGIQRTGSYNAQASGEFSFAPSRNSRAYGQDSIAMGLGAIASGFSQTVVGQYNDPNLTDYFIVGNGTISTPSNAFRVTTSGSSYIQNKLFVTNVEIETTGASTNHALIFDGTKFKPQLQIITGLTFFPGGSNFTSSVTNNSLLVKALTGSTDITITDSNGLITIGLQLSGTNAITLIQSLTGGTSIVSAKTGTTYFLYPIQGSGGTSVGLTDNKVTIYSDPISLINGSNVGIGGAGVFSIKAVNELQFRRLSSATPTNLSIFESGELVIFSSKTSIGTYVSGITSAGTGSILLLSGTVVNNNLVQKTLSAGTGIQIIESNDTLVFTNTGGTSTTGITSGASLSNGVKVLFSSNTTSLSFATLSSQTPSILNIISSSTGLILFSAATPPSSSGLTTAINIGDGVKVLFSSDTTNLGFATLSSQTPSTLRIISSATGLILFSAATGSNGISGTYVSGVTNISGGISPISGTIVNNNLVVKPITAGTNITVTETNGVITIAATGGVSNGFSAATSVGNGLGIISSTTNNQLKLFSLSSATPSSLSIISSSTGLILFSAATPPSTSGLTTAINVGTGVNVLFSSSTTNLAFATLSSQTPSTLSIISSATGLILFSSSSVFSSITIDNFSSNSITLISGYNAYSNPTELNLLIADDLGSQEKDFDIYQLNYFTEKVVNPINPLVRGQYSAFTGTNAFGTWSGISFTVGRESYFRATAITSGDTIIGTVFRNRFVTKNYNASNALDNSGKNIIGTAFFNQTDSNKFNLGPFVGTLMETHLLGNQQPTFHNEIRNLQLGFFNRGWVYRTSVNRLIDLHINRPILNAAGFNAYNSGSNFYLSATTHAAIFIDSRTKLENIDVLSRPLNILASPSPIIYGNTPWSLFAEADRAYIGNTLVLTSALTLSSTTRGAWLDIGASLPSKPHINLSAGTDPTSPQIGDLWWNGNELYFRQDSATTINILRNNPTSKVINVTTNGIIALSNNYLYDRITLTSSTASVTITSITANASISSYTPSIRFFAETDLNVTFRNSSILKTEGGLDAVISGSTYDNITFEYNPISEKFYQININNYI